MRHAIKRGVLNGLLLSFWVLAFAAAPRVSDWVSQWLYPDVYFNMR